MNWIQFLFFKWRYKKQAKYILKTGKIPSCSCDEFYKTGSCKHLKKITEELRLLLNK